MNGQRHEAYAAVASDYDSWADGAGDVSADARQNRDHPTDHSRSNSILQNGRRALAPTASRLRGTHRKNQLSVSSLGEDDSIIESMADDADGYPTTVKNNDSTDWYFEGPGQRVGYDDMTAIDWIFEYTKERQRLRALLSSTSGLVGYVRQLLDASQIWMVLIGTGIAAGIIAACIDIASDWLGDLKTGYCRNGQQGGKFYLNKGFCCWGLEGKGLIGLPRKREVLSAAAAAGISVAFGSPIGGVLFSLEQLSYYFPDKTMWQSFVCAMIAAVTLQAFNPFRTGKLVQYQVTYTRGWHDFETVPFALLGVIGGLYGAVFIRLNMKVAAWRKTYWLAKKPIVEVTIVALITAIINYPNLFMRAQSSELVYSLFAECSAVPDDQFGLCKSGLAVLQPVSLLLLAAVLGIGLASITFGLQIPAGVILPSMAIGALYGRVLGILVEVWQRSYPHLLIFSTCEADVPCVTPGTYAIIGAASALGGVTRMTVSIVVIMFELTGALTYVLPIMIAVMISKWVGDAMGKRGIYESWIQFNEYPFVDNRDDTPVPITSVSEVMTRVEDLVVLTASGHTIQTLSDLLSSQPYRGFPVISDSRDALLLGYISRTELAFAVNSAVSSPRRLSPDTEVFFSHHHHHVDDDGASLDLRPWMDQTPITLSSKSSFQLANGLFQKLGLRYVLLCDRGVLQGLLTKKDLWYVLNQAGGRNAGEGRWAVEQRSNDSQNVPRDRGTDLSNSPVFGR
ncbi:MAG: hypothetical protein M1823_002690 [Watsoniomyces obsoletus]|nr:MAG: hypothetical protein M1823_002690 [Watsoniomyces obsoletus]